MSRAGGSLLCLSFSLLLSCPDVAAFAPSHTTAFGIVKKQTALHVIPPANSPYLQPSDEPNPLPSGYDPQLEVRSASSQKASSWESSLRDTLTHPFRSLQYPGTMRPSKVRENSPFEDLPLLQTQDEAGDEQQPTLQSPEVEIGGCGVNVPWPHFQDIPYHLTWGAANEDTGPIDEFIGLQGRWMTEEEEEEVTRFSRPRNKGRVEAQVVVEDDEEDEEEEDDDSFEGGGEKK